MYNNYRIASQPLTNTYIPYTGAREYTTSRSPSPIHPLTKNYYSTSKKVFQSQQNPIPSTQIPFNLRNNYTPNTKFASYTSTQNTPRSTITLQPQILRVSNTVDPISPIHKNDSQVLNLTPSSTLKALDFSHSKSNEAPLCFFERIQEVDDYQSKQIMDFLSQASRNLADCGEAVVEANYKLTANKYAGKKRYLEEFNKKAMEANDEYRRNLIYLIEDLRSELKKEPDGRSDGRDLEDILDFIERRRMPQQQLKGQLNEIAVCCDPELSGASSRKMEELSLINMKRSQGAVPPVMPDPKTRRARRSSPGRRSTSRRNSPKKSGRMSSYFNTKRTSRHNSTSKVNRSPRMSSSKVKKSPKRQEPVYTINSATNPEPAETDLNSFYTPPKTYKKPEIVQIVNMAPKILKKNSIKRSTLKDFKLTEDVDSQIINKASFFSNLKTDIYPIGDVMANKLDMNHQQTNLFLTGVEGTTILDTNGPILGTNQIIPEAKSTTVKCLPGKRTILQEINSNNLSINILGLGGLKQIALLEGDYEAGKVIEDLHCYRHSLDSYFFLWRSGQDNLSIVDIDTFEVNEVLNRFWTFENSSTMPVAACSDRAAERIIGISQAGPENYVLHYYEDSPRTSVYYVKPIGEVITSVTKITSLDVSFDETRVYLAGLANINNQGEIAVVIACEFDQNLKEISAIILADLDYGTPRRLKRIRGSEMLILGCDKHFSVLEFVSTNELNQITSLKDIHDNQICDFVLRGKYLYSKAFNEPLVKVTEFEASKENVYVSSLIGSSAFTNFPPATRDSVYNHSGSKGMVLQDQNFNSKYSKFYCKKLTADGMKNLEKVTTSIDGTRLYLGGKGLHLFKFTKDGYMASDIDSKGATNFFAVRTTNSGNLVIQEPVSNNMIVLTGESFEVVRVLKGKQKCVFNSTYLRNPHFTGEDNTVIWFTGTSSIAIVNFDNLKPFYIDNFLPFFSDKQFGIAARAVAKDQGNAIFCTYVMENSFFFSTYFKNRKPQQKKVSRFFNNMYKLYAIELSLTKSVIFCGGATRRDKKNRTSGVLAAVSFNETLDIIRETVLNQYDVETCTAIRRFRDRNDIVVGCLKNILVVEFSNGKFEVLNVVYGLHSYTLTDIWIFGDRIFTVCRKDDYACEIAFQHEE